MFHLCSYGDVRAGVRRWNSAVRLARNDIDLALCDVCNLEQLTQAAQDCKYIVHCAVGDDLATIEGTRNVLEAAKKLGVERVIHISSASVYGRTNSITKEDQPFDNTVNAYARRKQEAEKVCHEYSNDVHVTILRPTLIYGPFGATWTESFAQRLTSGNWGTLGTAGEGTCNLVYVTDVVHAIKCALEADIVSGQAYNINGNDIPTWNEYFTSMNASLKLPPLKTLSVPMLKARSYIFNPVRKIGNFVLGSYRDQIMKVYKSSKLAERTFNATEGKLKTTPTPDQLALYGSITKFDILKAEQQLDWRPRVTTAEGIELSCKWVKHHRLTS